MDLDLALTFLTVTSTGSFARAVAVHALESGAGRRTAAR